MAVRIRCINKSLGNHLDPHEAISFYGWINELNQNAGKNDRPSMVQFIEDGGRAYVKDNNGNIAYCYVRTSNSGTKFLQTYTDNRFTDNLLYLPECL